MSVYFTKVFASLTESTIWSEPDTTRIAWVTMLVIADEKGRVFGSIPGLAHLARISVEKMEEALVAFMSPDKYSRSTEQEGRRIEKIDGGWRLINYEKYRNQRDEEARKEYQKAWIAKKRAVEKAKGDGEESRSLSSVVDKCRHNRERDREREVNLTLKERASTTQPVGTSSGHVCARLRKAGIQGVNPSNPKLLALLTAGVPEAEFGDLADEDGAKGKSLAWILATIEGRRRDAAAAGTVAVTVKAWHESASGIEAKAVELGVERGTEIGRASCRERVSSPV